MNETQSPTREVVHDLSDEYNNKVSSILEEIDEIKLSLFEYPENIIYLNERLHSLFCKLHPKIFKLTNGKIKSSTQIKYHKVFEKIKRRIFKTKRNESGESYKMFNPQYNQIKKHVEKRELHLNSLLEEMGLTAKDKIKQKRLR